MPVYSTPKTRVRHFRPSRRVSIILVTIAVILACVTLVDIGFAIYLQVVAATLPDIHSDLDALISQRTTIVYAADGSLLAEWHGEQDRQMVGYDDMPTYLRNAVISIEDKRFYEHRGIDTQSILRAIGINIASGQIKQGGSTIAQQVAKNLFTNGERTFTRKVREALMANALEAHADKAKVLELYLNTVYFGRGYYGVETASEHYFGKPAQSLTIAEAATLAGVIESPNRLNPVDNPGGARARRDLVLGEMADQGYLTKDMAAAEQRQPLKVARQIAPAQHAAYFTEWVKQELIDRLGAQKVYTGGLRVYTTLQPALQSAAESAARKLSKPDDPEVALVAMRHDNGQVLAMVGGRDFGKDQFNLATQGRRQPGSAFKPFVLATALEQGISPNTRFSAAPYQVRVKDGVWNVQNYENRITGGSLTLGQALDKSVNAVFARLIMRVGAANVVKVAKKMGITTPLDPDPAIALGGLKTGVSPLEMTSAFSTVANYGMTVSAYGVQSVLDDEGHVIYQPKHTSTRGLDSKAAHREASMLHDVVEHGTAKKAQMGHWAAGKTGTTQSYRDAWFVGWSGDVATGVWVGYRDGQVSMTHVHGINVTGGSYPAQIWSQFMSRAATFRGGSSSSTASSGRPGKGDVLVRICQDSLLLANPRCPHPIEVYFAPSAVPTRYCTIH